MKRSPKSSAVPVASAAFAALLSSVPSVAEAQLARYVGRATAVILEEGPLQGDVGAGGLDADGLPIEERLCDVSIPLCFDESAVGLDLGIAIVDSVRVVGGANDETGAPRPGFPRVDSFARSIFLGIPDVIEIGVAESHAFADASTGELGSAVNGVVVRLGGDVVIPVPAGSQIEIPGVGTVLAGAERIRRDGNLRVIEVDGAVLDSPELGKVVLGRSIAGLEMAATSGGFAGGGGCSVLPGSRPASADRLALFIVALGALGWVRLRKRKRTS